MKDSNKSGIIIGVVALVAVVGGIIWFTNRNSDTKNDNQTQTAQSGTMEQSTAASKDIVVLATETQPLSTLVTAVKAADLVSTLQGKGPFTVFAPTNAAFEALPAGTLDTLLKPANKDQLSAILTYHVVPGKVMASDLKDGQKITTVQGGVITVSIKDGKVFLIDAKGNKVQVEQADVNASNGVVHIINGVLLPQ